ncbi:iron chaperone [Pedobacter terrae]|uniref:iron chaperone n=1 Tax=Pedobacter terrae TaxID=405671 RepID=UPI002FF6B3D5
MFDLYSVAKILTPMPSLNICYILKQDHHSKISSMEQPKTENIDQYIANFPIETQKLLKQVRDTIHEAVPEAKEVISYRMPAFKQNGVLAYFAGYAKHIVFIPLVQELKFLKLSLPIINGVKAPFSFP